MFARVHTLETGPEEYERGYQMIRDVLLPWARESTGFCGLIGLVDEDRNESLVITLWADEESAEASASAGDKPRRPRRHRIRGHARVTEGVRRHDLRRAGTAGVAPPGAARQRARATASGPLVSR